MGLNPLKVSFKWINRELWFYGPLRACDCLLTLATLPLPFSTFLFLFSTLLPQSLRIRKTLKSLENYLSLCFRFSAKKGFFCRRGKKRPVHCLGIGKGRKYPKIDFKSLSYLRDYYRLANLRFALLLQKQRWTLPKWLQIEINNLWCGIRNWSCDAFSLPSWLLSSYLVAQRISYFRN